MVLKVLILKRLLFLNIKLIVTIILITIVTLLSTSTIVMKFEKFNLIFISFVIIKWSFIPIYNKNTDNKTESENISNISKKSNFESNNNTINLISFI